MKRKLVTMKDFNNSLMKLSIIARLTTVNRFLMGGYLTNYDLDLLAHFIIFVGNEYVEVYGKNCEKFIDENFEGRWAE